MRDGRRQGPSRLSPALSTIWRPICRTCPGPIASVDCPGNAGRARRDPREGGFTAACLVGSTRPSGARMGSNIWSYTGSFDHRPNNRYGENAYTISGGTAALAQVVNSWARRRRDMTFAAIPAPRTAATTRRLSAEKHERSVAPHRSASGALGAIAIRQKTSSDSGHAE
jgi:hypothetical protein